MADDDDLDDLLGAEPTLPPSETPIMPGRARLRASRAGYLRPRKLSNGRMVRVIEALTAMPVAADAAMLAGISMTTLKYWRLSSSIGKKGDGYDVVLDPEEPDETVRFHEAFDDAMQAGLAKVERVIIERATGFKKVLQDRGRVTYRHDFELVKIFGYECAETLELDPITGQPVPETVWEQDSDLLKFIAKTRMPETYGDRKQIDVNVKGGVLAVPSSAASSQAVLTDQSYKADAVDVEFEEVVEE